MAAIPVAPGFAAGLAYGAKRHGENHQFEFKGGHLVCHRPPNGHHIGCGPHWGHGNGQTRQNLTSSKFWECCQPRWALKIDVKMDKYLD